MQKKVIISPLDWGLGHTSRIVPVIRQYIDQDFDVLVACNHFQQSFLKRYFPNLQYLHLKGYGVKYAAHGNFFLHLIGQIPKIFFSILIENFQLRSWVKMYQPDVIVSDNRYGFFHPKVDSIFITHQLYPIIPAFERITQFLINIYLKFFDEVHVPDLPDNINYSGKLSHRQNIGNHIKYIGLLSQFQIIKETKTELIQNQVLFLLSGVEPQRSLLEKELLSKTIAGFHYVLVRGKHDNDLLQLPENVLVKSVVNAEELQKLILASNFIVCRSGYSTLMDLIYLEKNNVLLIPTPGQTEQEYLAKHFSNYFGFTSQNQGNVNLSDFLQKQVFP